MRRGLFDDEDARAMLSWPHAGFHVHDGVWVSADDTPFVLRLARYCARNPVALDRLVYEPGAHQGNQVMYRSDKSEGPTAGTETCDPLEFLARLVTHIPDKGQVMQRYYGWYANRTRGCRRRAQGAAPAPVVVADPVPLPLGEARRPWASRR